jgi:Zn-dependent protease/predicted transcriptional regulator
MKVRRYLRMGSISGIEIQLFISSVITLSLIIVSLSIYFHSSNPAWGIGLACGLALITGALFCASMITNEISRAIVARMHGLRVSAISLFALGGMTQIENEAADARSEFRVGIVGTFTYMAIGFCCLTIAWLNGWEPMSETMTPIQVIIIWLGYLNIGLGIINLTPAFPMDGGYILRAIMWWITGDRRKATKRILLTGKFFASCYLVIGILLILKSIVLGGLLLLIIGWYLDVTTQVKVSQRDILERLRGVCVRDLMARQCPYIDGNTNLQTFVENHHASGGESCFMILERGKLTGLITLHDVRNIGHRRWPYTVIYDVMNRIDQMQTVKPEAPITDALELMGSQTNQLAVMSNGRLVGILSRDHIMGHLLARSEF